jgi:hypothetical protein
MTAVLLDELSSESAPRARRRVHGTSWSDHLIDDSDLRLLHMLATGGPLEITFLQHLFHRGLSGMLGRLEDAGVVVVGQSSCRARSLSKVFAVEQIIAVEAKVSAHKRLLEQAAANSWFSSESYALLPNIRAGARICGAAAAKGVGVIALEHGVAAQVNAAFVRGVPLSYGSWLFNEWTWRLARLQGTI